MNNTSLFNMGSLGRAHGIKGEISAEWHGEAAPTKGTSVYLQCGDNEPVARRIISCRRHNGRLLLAFEGINDRTDAEKLNGAAIMLPRDKLPPPAADEAFVQDLPGAKIWLRDGSFLGMLDHIDFPAGQMIWHIQDEQGREILFPAQPCFIDALDMSRHEAVINPPEGLLDIYRA